MMTVSKRHFICNKQETYIDTYTYRHTLESTLTKKHTHTNMTWTYGHEQKTKTEK